MSERWDRRALLSAAMAASLAGCDEAKSWPFQYRLKMTLSSRRGERAGATVFRTVYRRVSAISLNQDQIFNARAWGEAIPIEIGGGDYVFAIQHPLVGAECHHGFMPVAEKLFEQLAHVDNFNSDDFKSGKYYEMAQQMRGEIDLPHMYWPLLLHFDDLANKETASLVPFPDDECELTNTATRSLESLLGLGARVDRVTIEYTNEPVTYGLQRLLPWIADLPSAPGKRGLQYVPAARGPPLPKQFQYRLFVRDGASR